MDKSYLRPSYYQDKKVIQKELDEIVNKLSKLEEFMWSDKYKDLPAIECALLQNQFNAMESYYNTLKERLEILNNN